MRLVFTPAARRDIAEAIAFIAEDDPGAARRQMRRVQDAAQRPSRFPGLGVALGDDRRGLQVAGTPFRRVCRATSETIVILRLWHGARQWPPASR